MTLSMRMTLSKQIVLPVTLLVTLALGACSHKQLKAPCSREDGEMQVMSYAPAPAPSTNPLAHLECGPLRSIGE